MRAVVGLGNPGKKYNLTRHNIGFLILDTLAEKYNLGFKASRFDYYYSEGLTDASDFFLIKPTTYMNLSGSAVKDFIDVQKVDLYNLLVVADDVNLITGKIRLRKSGSHGGHNGIKSIIYHLQSEEFPRLRFGIGGAFDKGDMADFVLEKFAKEELEKIKPDIDFAVELLEAFISGGFKSATDLFSANNPLRQSSNSEDEQE